MPDGVAWFTKNWRASGSGIGVVSEDPDSFGASSRNAVEIRPSLFRRQPRSRPRREQSNSRRFVLLRRIGIGRVRHKSIPRRVPWRPVCAFFAGNRNRSLPLLLGMSAMVSFLSSAGESEPGRRPVWIRKICCKLSRGQNWLRRKVREIFINAVCVRLCLFAVCDERATWPAILAVFELAKREHEQYPVNIPADSSAVAGR